MENQIKRILMIDDDEEDFIIVKELFRDISPFSYDLEWCSNYADGLRIACENRHDICLVDYRLGMDDGLNLIRQALENGSTVPMIILTGLNDSNVDNSALELGAYDYLVKGNISPAELERTVRYSIERARNVHNIYQLNLQLQSTLEEQSRQLRERNALIREIQHRVKNNLQLIKSLLRLQTFEPTDGDRNHTLHAFYDKVETMSMIYNMTYHNEMLLSVNLNELLYNFRENILKKDWNKIQKFDLQLKHTHQTISIDTAIPLGLLLNELIMANMVESPTGITNREIELQLMDEGNGFFVMAFKEKVDESQWNQIADNSLNRQNLVDGLVNQLEGEFKKTQHGSESVYDIRFREVCSDPDILTTGI